MVVLTPAEVDTDPRVKRAPLVVVVTKWSRNLYGLVGDEKERKVVCPLLKQPPNLDNFRPLLELRGYNCQPRLPPLLGVLQVLVEPDVLRQLP